MSIGEWVGCVTAIIFVGVGIMAMLKLAGQISNSNDNKEP